MTLHTQDFNGTTRIIERILEAQNLRLQALQNIDTQSSQFDEAISEFKAIKAEVHNTFPLNADETLLTLIEQCGEQSRSIAHCLAEDIERTPVINESTDTLNVIQNILEAQHMHINVITDGYAPVAQLDQAHGLWRDIKATVATNYELTTNNTLNTIVEKCHEQVMKIHEHIESLASQCTEGQPHPLEGQAKTIRAWTLTV